MPQMAWLFSTAHVEGLKNESFSVTRRGKKIDALERARRFEKGRVDSGNTRARIIKSDRKRYGSPGRARASDTRCRTR